MFYAGSARIFMENLECGKPSRQSVMGGVLQDVIGTNWRRNLPSRSHHICLGDLILLSCLQRCSCWEKVCQWHWAQSCSGWAAQSCLIIVSGSYWMLITPSLICSLMFVIWNVPC